MSASEHPAVTAEAESRLYALGLDPGPARTGAALISYGAGKWRYHDGGHLAFGGGYERAGKRVLRTGDELRALIRRAARVRGVVALEAVVGVIYKGRRPQDVFDTLMVQGQLAEASVSEGVEPALVPCQDAREFVCGRPPVSDAQVRIVAAGMLEGFPHELARGRETHIADAALYAIWAIARRLGLGFPRDLPGQVAAELWRAKQAEAQERAAEQVLGAVGSSDTAKGSRASARRAATATWPKHRRRR
jgi:Holliday junction resolvasome RuvABC endonuclease subunit